MNRTLFFNNIIIVFVSIFLIALSFIYDNDIYSIFIAFIIFLIGVCSIILSLKYESNIINFYNAYYLIWLVLIPITSLPYPLMDVMSVLNWRYCLLGNVCFSLSIIFINFLYKPKQSCTFSRFTSNGKIGIKIYYFLLILSIFAYIVSYLILGEISLFSGNVKINQPFLGYNVITSLGALSIYILSKQISFKNKFFVLLVVSYFILAVLSGIRWNLILLLIALLSSVNVTKKRLYILFMFIILTILLFLIANSFRKGADEVEKFYIDTGIYSGSISLFINTEIFRYFGMCQRNIEEYVNLHLSGQTGGIYTFYSFAKRFKDIELPNNIWVNGYNALNVIGYLYLDFGNLWPLVLFLRSSLLLIFYKKYKVNKNDIFLSYMRALSFISIILSFYAYMQHYTNWIILFPVTVLCVNFIDSLFSKQITSTEEYLK